MTETWGPDSPAPGLLAAGGDLEPSTLIRAYSQGIFPWYSEGQPILWWSTSPRMTLQTREFRLHRSLKKAIRSFNETPSSEIRVDSAFERVIDACSRTPRAGQSGTWILPDMQLAYRRLHDAGYAHSVETWQNGELVGGLYCVSIGGALFGESMFALQTDASKIALAALVAIARHHGLEWIDCQQVTAHLAFMGARPVERSEFQKYLQSTEEKSPPHWKFDPLYWNYL